MADRKVVLITGGSAGIGAAVARMAAKQGFDVALTYRTGQAAAQTVAEDVRAGGQRCEIYCCDVADPAQIDAMFAAFDKDFHHLDALVNNAGIVDVKARVDEIDHARLRRIFDVNVIGAFLVAGQAVRRMSTKYGGKGGVIVNMSSIAAKLGAGKQYVDYAATKGAIDTMTIGLAQEVAKEGIRVVGIRPGIIDTEIHAKGGEPERGKRMEGWIPMKRMGTAEEIAEAALWLISDKASYVTGSTLDVSGGR
ncbi:SDR family oxidoreductase [Profundibacter sp.]|uniref:SDR family oxidoreductase n=1 Tax=Profundibacter sp. TaxID=3101071 RepID=UPI003D0B872C